VLPFYTESMGASAAILGLMLSAYAAMQFVFAPIWGRLSDRIGRRPVLLFTVAGTAGALLLLGLADSLLGLFAARLLGGVFGANISVASAYITDVTPEEERTRWMGMLGASFGVGFVLGPAIGGLLSPYGYAVPMLVASAVAGANLAYTFFALPEPDNRQTRDTPGAERESSLRQPLVRRLVITNLAFSLAVTQLEAVFAFFMMDRFRYDAQDVAWILVLMAVVMVGVQGGGMRALASRFGERQLLITGSAVLGLSMAVTPWMYSVPVLLIPLLLSSVGRGVSQPSMMSLVSVTADASERGTVMGRFQSAASLARVFGPAMAGLLYDVEVFAPFLLAGGLMAVVVVLAVGLPHGHVAEASAASH
jgi:DHA1 family tetracycline resistance protein-like MFS transporter